MPTPAACPTQTPVWVDFGGHDAPIPAKPGHHDRRRLRHRRPGADARGRRRDRPLRPQLQQARRHDDATRPTRRVIDARAKSLFDYAVSVTGCQTPMIAENELAGAQTPTPWTPNNAQYRANVLQFLTDLHEPRRDAAALDREPAVHRRRRRRTGGSRSRRSRSSSARSTSPRRTRPASTSSARRRRAVSMRQSLRGLVNHLTQIGIPSGRVALEMQFTTSPGLGQRAGLAAGGGLARDREARGARREVRRDAVQAGGRLVVGLGDLQRERRPPTPTRPRPRASGCGRATRRSATARPPPAPASTRR